MRPVALNAGVGQDDLLIGKGAGQIDEFVNLAEIELQIISACHAWPTLQNRAAIPAFGWGKVRADSSLRDRGGRSSTAGYSENSHTHIFPHPIQVNGLPPARSESGSRRRARLRLRIFHETQRNGFRCREYVQPD